MKEFKFRSSGKQKSLVISIRILSNVFQTRTT